MRPIRNAPYTHLFALYDNSTHDLVDAPASFGTVKILGDDDSGSPETSVSASAARVGASTGYCSVALTAGEFKYERCGVRVDASGTNSQIDWIETESCIDSGVAQEGTARTIKIRSAATLGANQARGHVIELVAGTGAGQTRIVVSNDASDVLTVDRDWGATPDETTVYIIHRHKGPPFLGTLHAGRIDDSSPDTDEFNGDTNLSSDDDFYNHWILTFLTGDNAGLAREVMDYDGTNRTFTFGETDYRFKAHYELIIALYGLAPSEFVGLSFGDFPATPSNGDAFLLFARVFV